MWSGGKLLELLMGKLLSLMGNGENSGNSGNGGNGGNSGGGGGRGGAGGGMEGWGRGGNSVGGHLINLVDGVGVISLGVLTDGINQSPETLIQLIGSQTIVQGFFAIAREAGRTIVRDS